MPNPITLTTSCVCETLNREFRGNYLFSVHPLPSPHDRQYSVPQLFFKQFLWS